MDFKDILNFHLAKKADITVACVPIPDEEISRMGILKMDSACRINRFLEKPKGKKNKAELYSLLPKEIQAKTGKSKAYLASMGIYLFKKEVLIEVLNASQKEDFGRQIIPEAVSKYKVYGYTFADYWEDIGTIASYFRASLELTKENPRFKLVDEKWPLFTHPRFLPGAIIRDSKVHQAIICNGCQIEKAEIDNSIIGIRTRIRPGAKIKEAILMGNDFYSFSDGKKDYRPLIGKNVTIQRAIIDKNVTIGDNCRIIGKEGVADRDEKLYCLRDGIVIIPRGRTIPSGFSV
jgi:glucose-1-phosphate adenylyltransferase